MDNQAFTNLDQLLQHLLADLEQYPDASAKQISGKTINMAKAVREFYTETSPPDGKAHFLQYCIVWLYNDWPADKVCSISRAGEYETAWEDLRDYPCKVWQTKQKILRCLARFGEHLILKCIYPMMVRSSQTSSTESSQDEVTHLRQDCFQRDGNRCVIGGKFNRPVAVTRYDTGECQDDDGNPLGSIPEDFTALQVAHIIPHELGWSQDSEETTILPRLNVLTILDMFLPGTTGRYHGTSIASPENAMTMDYDTHEMFGNLQIYFEPIQGTKASYTVKYVGTPIPPFAQFPKTVTFRTVTDIPLPDPNLLAIHRACARIAHATGADESCERFFRDLEDGVVEGDGSTPLDHLVAYRLAFHQNSGTNQP